MRRRAVASHLFMLVCAAALLSCGDRSSTAPLAAPSDLCIANVTIVSAERDTPHGGVDVVVRDDRIVAIGATGCVDASRVIDGTGRYLTPGLIDSHVHLSHATGLARRHAPDYETLRRAFMTQQPRSYLYYGYTTLIDLNADVAVNASFEAAPLHPDLYHCARGLVLSNDFMGSDYDSSAAFRDAYPNFLHDRFTTPQLPDGLAPSAHTPAATVARIASQGGRCVKMYFEEALWWPGPDRPDFALPSTEIVREVVREAHARRLPVVLHGTTPRAYELAIAAGVDVLAHGLWEWPGSPYTDPAVPPDVRAGAVEAARRGIGLQPTFRVPRNTPLSMFEPDLLSDPAWTRVVPGPYLAYLKGGAQAQRDEYLARMAPTFARDGIARARIPAAARDGVERYERLMGELVPLSPRWLFGTDTAVGGAGWGNPPGLNGYWEMCIWARIGVPLDAIFRAATLENARAFGLDAEVGTVAVGKRANLLLLRANPLDDVGAWDTIERVILGGVVLERPALAADAPGSAAVTRAGRG